MGYGGKTANGLSSLGPKMGGKAHGGGVKIEKNNISQSQDNVLSGKFTSMGSAKIVGKGMMKYMAGEPVGMGKYKSNAQRKAAHASMAEQGAGKYGKHMGPEKELVGNQNRLPEELKKKIEEAPGKYTRADKTKAKAKDAKDKAEKTFNDSGVTVKGTRQGLKADRLAKRQKRQEGRAERKNIRKKAKEGKIIDGKSGEYNAMSKKEKIKASRKKQKAEDPVVKKESSSGKGGMMKAGDMKKVKKVNEMSNRRRKDTYSYQEPKAKVLKK